MAELDLRLPSNAPGRFYVDSSCIDCDLCRQIAPDFFARNDEVDLTNVVRQPIGDEEEALALEAVDECPSCSIGSDGDADEVL